MDINNHKEEKRGKKPLMVYTASAGSGKTYTLAREYITRLIDNPNKYRQILAVTFTNKATEEMKSRILTKLYGIWRALPDSDDFYHDISRQTGLPERVIRERAGKALIQLLHNYSYFRVETIDSFFQSVMRNLARELDLTPNLSIGLNDMQVEEMAVDQLIDSLDSNSTMLKWLLRYIVSNINDNKSWNVIRSIKQFGNNIFKDAYKAESANLKKTTEAPGFWENYIKEIDSIKRKAKTKMEECSSRFFSVLDEAGIDTASLKGGANRNAAVSYFNKIKGDDFSSAKCLTKTLLQCMESSEAWVTKTNPNRDYIKGVVDEKLIDILNQTERERSRLWKLYLSADVTGKNLYLLRLLDSIEKKVRELNADANRFLLSDTQHLLKSLITNSDSPFIFEKIGTRLDHIMIDEFQDTSTTQWNNFKVLLEECMSRSNDKNLISNMIVGDVKQSIYRWRSGDWRLLKDIEKEFDNADAMVGRENLDTNYRSEGNIVTFNNVFFRCAVEALKEGEEKDGNATGAEDIAAAYSTIRQNVKKGNEGKGLVRITLLDGDDDYEALTFKHIENAINELTAKGIEQKDIAILTRKNSQITMIADYFLDKQSDINIISDEAFRLDASVAVCMIVNALRYITNPNDNISLAYLVKTYRQAIMHSDAEDNEVFMPLAEKGEWSRQMINSIAEDEKLPTGLRTLLAGDIARLRQMPLVELVEHLLQVLGLNEIKGEDAYLCTFFDSLNAFTTDNTADVDAFLKAWNEEIYKKTISSNKVNAITGITIHKSKGLEFENVIIPFCDNTVPNNEILWCKPDSEPFSDLPIVPVPYSAKLAESVYADSYLDERTQKVVDSLNVWYVAFTRASRNLFVIGKQSGVRAKSPIQPLLDKLDGSDILDGHSLDKDDDTNILTFEYGALSAEGERLRGINIDRNDKEVVNCNVFEQKEMPVEVLVSSYNKKLTFLQSNKSRAYINSGSEEERQQKGYINEGLVLHQVLSRIKSVEDIDRVLAEVRREGVFTNLPKDAASVSSMLNQRLRDKRVAEWFKSGLAVYSECDILNAGDGKTVTKRPDRVIVDNGKVTVIDYKFGKPDERYNEQVREYMLLMRKMGYKDVCGYVWYVYSNETKEVKIY